MTDDNQTSSYRLEHAIGSGFAPQPDQPSLNDTMAESLRFRSTSLPGIDSLRPGANDDAALQEARMQIQRLQQTLIEFEAEHARLVADYKGKLADKNVQLANLQTAYDEFERQSDLLMHELDQQNERLRAECRAANPRSVL